MMKATGIVRRVDRLGRIVLPVELRAQLEIGQNTLVGIYLDGNTLVIAKHREGYIFCGSSDTLKEHHGRLVCRECISGVARNNGLHS